jgi:hypothetical protein
MPDLTEADYDALFAVMKDDMPRDVARDLPGDAGAARTHGRAHHHRD